MTADEIRTQRDLDELWMGIAMDEARQALAAGQRPFGCVIVNPVTNKALGWGDGSETRLDPTRHSELDAIRMASSRVGGSNGGRWLTGMTLYSTHEPCPMCCGAITHAKLSRVVYGSSRSDLPQSFRRTDRSLIERLSDTTNPPTIRAGVRRLECIELFGEERLRRVYDQEAVA